jgi:hypothetical protein
MVMGINVKRKDVVDNVHILAGKLGLGITETIDQAVTEKLAKIELERQAEIVRRMASIREIQAEAKKHIRPGVTSNHDWMYDENGLPI